MTEKYRTRSIIVLSANREIIHAMIANAPDGIEIIAREHVKTRGNDANAYYWKRISEISEQAWFAGKQFNTDVWHEYLKENVMPEIIIDKDGNERGKWDERPDGKLSVISTTRLSKKSFSEYTTAVESFGASLGVQFSANPRQY